MKHILQIVIILFFFFLLPFFCGTAWNKGRKRRTKSLSYIFIYGYVVTFAVFFIYARLMIACGSSFLHLAHGFVAVALLLFVPVFFYTVCEVPQVIRENMEFLKNTTGSTKLMMGFVAVLCIASILFVIPSKEDATPETIVTTLATDTVFLHDPYTDNVTETPDGEDANAPLVMLYASVCHYTGMSASKFVHAVLPVPFFLCYFFVYLRIGKQLFHNREDLSTMFVFLVTLFFTCCIYSERAGVMGVFQNIWMPQTLLFQVFLPFVFSETVHGMDELMSDNIDLKSVQMKYLMCDFIILVLACQLIHYIGGFLAMLLLFCGVAIVLIRRIYKKCRES